MVRQTRLGLTRTDGLAILGGTVAALAMTTTTLLERVFLGVPLPVELVSDRIIPTLSIQEFNRVVARFGGLVKGKEVAFFLWLAGQLALGLIGGVVLLLVALWWWRRSDRGGHRPRLRPFVAIIGVPLFLVWLLSVIVLWPVASSNYRGLSPGWALVTTSIGLLVALGVYGAVLVTLGRSMTQRSATLIDPSDDQGADRSGRPVGRRALLVGGAGLVLAAISGLLTRSLYRRATFGGFGYDGLQTRGLKLDTVTPNDRFYVVTKNLIDPDVDADLWRLQVTGEVERPHTYGFQDLRAMQTVTQPTTLECISNPVGGHLMSNAVWEGVPLRTLLASAGPNPQAALVVLHAADGYVHTVPLDRAMNPATLVAFAMNGVPLPRRHGYPVRVLVPGGYGEVSVKWVDRIELADHTVRGYYERQGWKAQTVQSMSRIDRPAAGSRLSLAAGPVEIGGVAFAGDRGIRSVEVSTDGGRAWTPASIDYGVSPLSWTLWSLPWQPQHAGSYELVVRATDGEGAPQVPADHGPAPSGATGYHRVTVSVV
jgi:DMSO/TMAO reductase YedYZ molybdopterin-dependent catalytic subunit